MHFPCKHMYKRKRVYSMANAALHVQVLEKHKKMKMEVELVSKEFIKPSSPTPSQLKTHKLSLLDHFFPPIYFPMVLFYMPSDSRHRDDDSMLILQLLKSSLSETLTHFYTFAGKLSDDGLTIDCGCEGENSGALFYEAKADFDMLDYLSKPDHALINKLIPPTLQPARPKSPTAIFQLTMFACGGFSLCAYAMHAICDGISIAVFLKHWAATTATMIHEGKGVKNNSAMPNFDAALSFPLTANTYPREASLGFLCAPFFKEGKSGTRRFVFNSESIARLKDRVAAETRSKIQNPSRLEAVSAIICKAFSNAVGSKPVWTSHLVNLRRRAVPPLPDNSIGNFIWLASTVYKEEGNDNALGSLVSQFKEAMVKVGADFIKSLQGKDALVKAREAMKEIRDSYNVNETVHLGISSWCGLGVYEVDFGWGKPVWITPAGPEEPGNQFLSVAVILDTAAGQGMEAWLNTAEDDLKLMEKDEDLLEYACVDPSPLKSTHQ